MGDEEEEYAGPVTVRFGGTGAGIEVRAHVAGHFDPLTGAYRWTGRLDPHPAVTGEVRAGRRSVTVRTPDGHEGTGTLADANLWGGHPVSGTGTPPFAVPEVRADE